MKRGIISIYWGDESKLPISRLQTSVKKYHPELEHKLIRIDANHNDPKSLNNKSLMFDLSPFDETLFLDIDTEVMGDLSFGFDKARDHSIAISICESPWAKRYTKIFSGDEIEYNTGVIFFNKNSKSIFDRWKILANEIDTSIIGMENGVTIKMPSNDQGSFAMAIKQEKFNPYVLPYNWNFRPNSYRSFFGPIKIWHDYSDPPDALYALNKYYENKDSVIQYHYST